MKKLFPDDEVYRTETFNVGQDWEIPIVGFFIIGANDPSKRTVMDFTEAQVQDLGTLIRTIRIAMKEVLHITDVYLFQNEDTDHGFHVWLFPRHEWMEQF
ncbi:MAG TPA: hypothetical protein VN495_00445, partial [Candidatus Paceibacterota bacterium]|nr:hypothetical protein [Candidatus Paceibacterota bacterium]